MILEVGTTLDEQNKLSKSMSILESVNATMKEGTSIIDPIFILGQPSSLNFNYVHCAEWGRFYFVRDIEVLTGGRIAITCHVDVLNSFKNEIKNCNVIINKQESDNLSSRYIDDSSYVTTCKDNLSVYKYPNGLTNTANILITAGG